MESETLNNGNDDPQNTEVFEPVAETNEVDSPTNIRAQNIEPEPSNEANTLTIQSNEPSTEPTPTEQPNGSSVITNETPTESTEITSIYQKEKDSLDSSYQTTLESANLALATLASDETMTRVRLDFEKLIRAYTASHENIQRVHTQYTVVEKEYRNNSDATSELLKHVAKEQANITSLTGELAKVQESYDACLKREEIGKETLRLLKQEIAALSVTVKQGVNLSETQELQLNELYLNKEALTKELDSELDHIQELRNRLTTVTQKIKESDLVTRQYEQEIYDLKEKNALKKGDIDAEMKTKDMLERELKDVRSLVATKSGEVRGKQDTVNKCTHENQMIEDMIRTQKINLEKLAKDQDNLIARCTKLRQECGEQISASTQLSQGNKLLDKEIKSKELDLQKVRNESKKINKLKDILSKKNRALENEKLELEISRNQANIQSEESRNTVEKIRHTNDLHRNTLEDLNRELSLIVSSTHKNSVEATKSHTLNLPNQQTKDQILIEMTRYQKEIQDYTEKIHELSIQRDKNTLSIASIQQEIVDAIQIIKNKELTIFDYKRQIIQTESKIKHQQALYEAVQSDRNLHSKHLIECQSQIMEMKRKLKIMNYQINGYKDDIANKEICLQRDMMENIKLGKDKDLIVEEMKTLKKQNDLAQAYIRTQQAEELKLNSYVHEAELERTRQEKSLNELAHERDNLSTQLMKQNDQLLKLYHQIKSNQTLLLRGEQQYIDRLRQIRLSKSRIKQLKITRAELKNHTGCINSLKTRLLQTQSETLTESAKITALEQELQHPVNVHRWRKLEGSNPKVFEMIGTLHAYQNKLKEKTQQDIKLGQQITELEQGYLGLKGILGKQIGPESLEQLQEYEKLLQDKKAQLRHMNTELNMYQAQGKEYKHAIQVLDVDINRIKKLYIQQYSKSQSSSFRAQQGLLDKSFENLRKNSGGDVKAVDEKVEKTDVIDDSQLPKLPNHSKDPIIESTIAP